MASLGNEGSSFFSIPQDSSPLSPMTDLAENLSSLSTAGEMFTPRRRISWCYSSPNQPVLNTSNSDFLCGVSASASPMFQERNKNINSDRLDHKSFRRSRTLPFYPLILKSKENISSSILAPNISNGIQNIRQFDIGSDSDSQDSGYSGFISQKGFDSQSLGSTIRSSVFTDEESEDGFMSIFDMDILDENESLPNGMASLLTKPLSESNLTTEVTTPGETYIRRRKSIRRCLSMTPEKSVASHHLSMEMNDDSSENQNYDLLLQNESRNSEEDTDVEYPLSLNGKSNFHAMAEKHSFKRPEPPRDVLSPIQNKRRKSSPLISCSIELQLSVDKRPILQRCYSETEAVIMRAVQKSDQQPDLIGDFTKPYLLPLIKGKHQDLKAISSETLAEVIKGDYKDSLESYTVVDCRYPYEYSGGHIKGAKNVYTKEDIIKDLLPGGEQPEQSQRSILIFHCEFSSERAPNLCRFLRNKDRKKNNDNYPLLHHPEIYVLEGGYKAFYEKFKGLCEPQQYLPMRHKDHEFDLRHFRAKSKSWGGSQKNSVHLRSGLKF